MVSEANHLADSVDFASIYTRYQVNILFAVVKEGFSARKYVSAVVKEEISARKYVSAGVKEGINARKYVSAVLEEGMSDFKGRFWAGCLKGVGLKPSFYLRVILP